MRVIGNTEGYLYNKKGFNVNMVNSGSSVNMNEVYSYLKKTQKKPEELTRQEYLMFRRKAC